jgi:hypothetical protein
VALGAIVDQDAPFAGLHQEEALRLVRLRRIRFCRQIGLGITASPWAASMGAGGQVWFVR